MTAIVSNRPDIELGSYVEPMRRPWDPVGLLTLNLTVVIWIIEYKCSSLKSGNPGSL